MRNKKSDIKTMLMSWMCCFSTLVTMLTFVLSTAQAQSIYPLYSGGYLQIAATPPPASYNAGFSFYSMAWPMLGDYPKGNNVESGLFATWMWPLRSISDDHYTTIEGGLGWWKSRSFQTATPKFLMGGVTWGNNTWWYTNSPGIGTAGGNGKYGMAQLSPSLLLPPDTLNLREGTNGKLFGYGYMALPLTEPKTTTAGQAVPTGNLCWTLFLNTGNFKGPAAFFPPYYWSQISLIKPQLAGQGLDSRWADSNKSYAMEAKDLVRAAGYDTAGNTYVRTMPLYYPVDISGYSLLMHRACVYDQAALWNEVSNWVAPGGLAPNSVFNSGGTYVQKVVAARPVWNMKNYSNASLGLLNWDGVVAPYEPNAQEFGYKWKTNQPTLITSADGSSVRLPEYYRGPLNATSQSQWLPIEKGNVPPAAIAALAGANFSDPIPHATVTAYDKNDPVWTIPGAVINEPSYALLGDGSYVTYKWYRFADQPTMQKSDMTLAERNRLQGIVVKMHREWRSDRDYIAPPTTGTLADLDPALLLTPPLGYEYGYVPIAWSQVWGGSVANPGSLKFTSTPATPLAGTPFSVTVQAVNTSGIAQNVTEKTLVQLSVASGYGTLSGATVGTIPSGSDSVTITGVIYSAADSVTLAASATCLSSGTSATLNFTNANGIVNLYNRPATAITANLATLNATLDCRGTNADVQVYWGPYNGGINPAEWANTASIGSQTNVISTNFSRGVTGLLPETTYYFTFSGTNISGSTWASKVLSFKTPPLAPIITGQPASRTNVIGSTASFTAVVLGGANFQWFKNGVPLTNGGLISGADTAKLILNGVTAGNTGSYSVIVRNLGGQITSATASLAVIPATNLTWDANGTGASVTDGAGLWASNSWWNGATNVDWTDNNNIQIGSGGVGGVISLNEVMVNDLTLSNFSGTYSLSDGILTVGSNLTFNSSGSAKLSSVIRGVGSVTKNGSGTLILEGDNSYSGGTIINSGVFTLANKFGLGTGPMTLLAGTTFQQSGFEGYQSYGALPNAFVLSGPGNITFNIPFGYKDIWLSSVISGSGGLTVQGGSRSLTLTANNTFSGGVKLTNSTNRIQISNPNALGKGTFRTEFMKAGSEGKLITLTDLSSGAGVPNAFDIASGACLNLHADSGNHLLLSGPIRSAEGIGNLYKSGNATLTLSGVNTYTGKTTVADGALACNNATALGQGALVIDSGGKIVLNYLGTRQIDSLSLSGTQKANGSYGSSTSTAVNKDDAYFTGNGSVTVGPVATTVASSISPALVGAAVTFTATVTGSTPTGNVSFFAGATLLGTRVLNGSFQASFTTSSLAVGTYDVTATYAGNASNSSSTSTAISQLIVNSTYASWSADPVQGLATGSNGPMDDPDQDGISNLLEFALGGVPKVSTQAILPTLKKSSSNWVFEYNRSHASLSPATVQVVEYGNELTGWTPLLIPLVSTEPVTITPGSSSDLVSVAIPVGGTKIFVRLKVTQ
jgi:autotransporter-associated beta strand protein